MIMFQFNIKNIFHEIKIKLRDATSAPVRLRKTVVYPSIIHSYLDSRSLIPALALAPLRTYDEGRSRICYLYQ